MRLPQSQDLLFVPGIWRDTGSTESKQRVGESMEDAGGRPPPPTPLLRVTWTGSFPITHDIVCKLCIGNIFVSLSCMLAAVFVLFLYLAVQFIFIVGSNFLNNHFAAEKTDGLNIEQNEKTAYPLSGKWHKLV